MAKIDLTEISSLIKETIKNYQAELKKDVVGKVLVVGDSVCLVSGLDDVMLNELVKFNDDLYGIAQSLESDHVGVILLGDPSAVKEGDLVYTTGRILEIPVGPNFLGRVINPLGVPQDGLGSIEAHETRPIESKAYGVVDRMPVNEPLQTGILVIDALIPIGKGQRELIIGDRQTGKTSIAVDTIISQKNTGVICIYVAIGQKESTVKNVYETLKAHEALEYSIIVDASASYPSSLLYIAPYAGVTLAEYFMLKGRDVLIIYDDLSKHAIAYREISLLLHRPPGREAYPGDVFYLHSRLLERSAKLNERLGGGSITALPIIETQDGDISAYIPTNVISITDGQIFLQTDYFYKGIRPAVNAGLSVSRVGGAAQTRAIKRVSGTLRLDLASYRELESFSQFGQDLDEQTKKRLARGMLTVEVLKQDIHKIYAFYEESVILYALTKGLLDDVPLAKIPDLLANFCSNLKYSEKGKQLKDVIYNTKDLPDLGLLEAFITEQKKKLL